MKKALLPLAVAAVLPVTAFAELGETDTSFYGKMNVTAVNTNFDSSVDGDNESAWNLNSNASRVGFKGKTQLGENLYAIYKAEFEVYVDSGISGSSSDDQTFKQRNIYVGLMGDYGTIIAGRHDSVLKLSQAKVDLFGDLQGGDIKNWMSGETRSSNMINYTTPKLGGFSLSVMSVLGEDSGDRRDGLLDSYSTGVSFSHEGLYLALSRDENVKSGSQEKQFLNINRFVASYAIGDLTLGAILQQAEDGDNFEDNASGSTEMSYDEDSFMVSAAYKLGDFVLKTQYGQGEYTVEDATFGGSLVDDDFEREAWVVGVDYKLAKSTKVYTYYSNIETDDNLLSFSSDSDVFGLGMEHKF
ncbi:porin [Aestuariicella hydrocarbonica]|uniref:Porin n=1 Tax=Pseudomaricurvus hydrocarbonicus TaxID=1470433 RepID=A0A9E5JUC5_9GAMM|nr:porin [Aestuariicella hydrocarbonica]NHO64725.1 porin [Aestuariicella hydrocarbonica]